MDMDMAMDMLENKKFMNINIYYSKIIHKKAKF